MEWRQWREEEEEEIEVVVVVRRRGHSRSHRNP